MPDRRLLKLASVVFNESDPEVEVKYVFPDPLTVPERPLVDK